MTSRWKWTVECRQVLRRPHVCRLWNRCRSEFGFSPAQTRRILQGAALPEDIKYAETRHQERMLRHAQQTS